MAEVDVSGAQKGEVGGLEPSKEYKVTVAAVNVKTIGPQSEPVDVKTGKIFDFYFLYSYSDGIFLKIRP